MIYFAYDGSINGDWVSRYAIRMAAGMPEPRLRLLHIRDDGDASHAEVTAAGIERIRRECEEEGIAFEEAVHAQRGSVAETLQQVLADESPAGSMLVLGTRVRPRHRRYLAGTVAEAMLAWRRLDIVAVRVVHPGLLGVPHTLMLSFAGDAYEGEAFGRLLQLLSPHIHRLHLLYLLRVRRLWWHLFGRRYAERQHQLAHAHIEQCEAQLTEQAAISPRHVDVRVRFADHPAIDMIAHARKHKAQLLVLGYDGGGIPSQQERRLVERLLKSAPCDVAIYGPKD
jgi:nucleotide-binding universal stress UspA family protein